MDRKSTDNFIGAWQLLSFEIRQEGGAVIQPFGPDPKGSIIYTDTGRVSAQVMRSDRPEFANEDQMKGTPGEMEASFRGCISYFGAYHVNREAGFVTHRIESSLFPNWEGDEQQRFFEFSGHRLTLSTPPLQWGGERMIAVLVWDRVQ